MRKWIVFVFLIPLAASAGDPIVLELERAYELAIRNYPLTRQKDLIAKTAGLNLRNLSSGFWPQVSLNGQVTYQSDVTAFTGKVPIPGLEIEPPSKDQYRAVLDVSQAIFDGGSTRSQKAILEQQRQVDEQRINVEYQSLKERINDIWFSVLLLEEQERLLQLTQRDIDAVVRRVEAQVENGTAFRSSLASLRAEKLKNDQRAVDIRYTRKGLLDVLSVFLAMDLPGDTQLRYPAGLEADSTEYHRPELELLKRQARLNDELRRSLDVRSSPRVSLFAQGGYGKPGLNMLLNEFDFFYIGGLRLSWNLSAFYNIGRERQVNDWQRQSLGIQEEQLMQGIRAEMKKYRADIEKYRELIRSDDEIILLRRQVSEASAAQLENGVITSSDYIREVNAEEQARLNQAVHKLQMLQAMIDHKTTTGN